jgi:uncharacterized protein YjbI with pentapeptide repeats
LSDQVTLSGSIPNHLKADCENCFGLCCVALPYAKSADFAFDKDGGTPCRNLQADFRCSIHTNLRNKGFRGCAVYECFGAGQKISQYTFKGNGWRENPALAKEMFDSFPIMQQLHEILYYLNEALSIKETQAIHEELKVAIKKIEELTLNPSKSLVSLDVQAYRSDINHLLLKASEIVRAKASSLKSKNPKKHKKLGRGIELIGSNLKGANLIGSNLRGALMIAADLREADLRGTDMIGADLRDADLRGANLLGCLFLTQAQINSAKGNLNTKIPPHLRRPEHWSA